MERALGAVEQGQEDALQAALLTFNEKNKTSFTLEEDVGTRQRFCHALLQGLSSGGWSWQTQSAALTSLRIAAREREGVERLRSREGLQVVASLAELTFDLKQSSFWEGSDVPEERVRVMVEAVKCLCNLVLTHHPLATTCTDLGVLHGLSLRLGLVRNVDLPADILTFDLRLLFLITACGVAERAKFRDEYDGLRLLVNLIDTALLGRGLGQTVGEDSSALTNTPVTEGGRESVPVEAGAGEEEEEEEGVGVERGRGLEKCGGEEREGEDEAGRRGSDSGASVSMESDCLVREKRHCVAPSRGRGKYFLPLPPSRDAVNILPAPLGDVQMGWVSEAMKIVFNQTAHWKQQEDYEPDEIEMLQHITVLIRIILVSIPIQLGKLGLETVTHSVEVLVNMPLVCARKLLLPSSVQIMPTLHRLYPSQSAGDGGRGDGGRGDGGRGGGVLDVVFDDWNMAVFVRLLDFLTHCLDSSSPSLTTILSAMRTASKGHRSIRRFLKSKILPPLQKVTHRPEEEDSLKGKLVRLMTAGTHNADRLAAEFLFSLCKESSSRLIKYTGYGNAAGLLFAHGLLSGGRSEGEGEYSSDSETSDTEEYIEERPRIDPVTAGPSRGGGEGGVRSALDEMSEEEKEREAEKLAQLMRELNEKGVIRVMPLDQAQRDILESPSTLSTLDDNLELD